MIRVQLLRTYYLSTPLFVLADVVWGVNPRVAGLEGYPALKAGYYAACLGCGLVAAFKPGASQIVGLAESAVNLLVLALGIFLPYYAVLDRVLADQPIPAPLAPDEIANFLIAGAVLSISFYGNPLLRRGRAL